MSVLVFTSAGLCLVVSLLMFWSAIRQIRKPGQLPWWMMFQNAMLFFFAGLGEACLFVTLHHRTEVITVGLCGVAVGIGLASLVAQVPLVMAERERKRRQAAALVNRSA